MWREMIPGLRITLFFTIVFGIAYPLLIIGLAQVLFPWQANGSLIQEGGRVVGSEWIGQNFTRPEYFHPRPSNAGAKGYDATASGGFNQGPTNKDFLGRLTTAVAQFRKENPDYRDAIPADAVTASASGLDPHLSPDAAEAQAARIAKARGRSVEEIVRLIRRHAEGRTLGILGEPRINVLRLNLALDREFPRKYER